MSALSHESRDNLNGVLPDLAQIAIEVTEFFDLHVLPGNVRTKEKEQELIDQHLSTTLHSMHIVQSDGYGHAIDVAPTPMEWDDKTPSNLTEYEVRQLALSFYIKGYAQAKGLKVRIGADFHDDNRRTVPTFKDLDHIEVPI